MRYLPGLLFLAAIPIWAQPCEISGEVKGALDAARTAGATANEAAKKVRDQFPNDYFAHRVYQDANMARGVFSAYVQGEYRAMRDQHPDDPFYITLFARALTGTKTPDALKELERALEKHPDYAYAHVKMAEIYNSQVFRDDPKMREHVRAYRKSCPTALSAYTLAARTDDMAFLAETAAGMRTVLEPRTDPDAISAYTALWTMEFKAVPLSAQEQARERVRKDVAKLRNMDLKKNPSLAVTLLQGYKIVGDVEGTKWAEGQVPQINSGMSPAMEAINKWRTANMSRMTSSVMEYQDLHAKQADEWIRQWPDDPQPRAEKFQALRMQRDAPPEQVVKAAEEWVRVYEANPGASSPYSSVAQYYASNDMHFDELPGLLDKALKDVREVPPPSLSDLIPASGASRVAGNTSKWITWNTAINAYIKLKQYDKARELLAKLRLSLEENKPAATAAAQENRQYGRQESLYWQTKAELARAEDRKLDALVFQKNAYRTNTFPVPAGMPDFRLTEVKDIWKELGGSDEGFEAFLNPAGGTPRPAAPMETAKEPTVASSAGRWTTMETPMPEFQFSDAKGKVWTLADLKGKVTLINLWATWCGPCRVELPYLQKVYDKVRDRKDLQVITFDTDDSRGLILPFMAENKYTFPVLPALDYVHKLVPQLSIPRNWIVDADGVLRSEIVGFGRGDDKWVDDMIATMEKARR
ncbi:hypothetical protein SBA3_1650005 [Candidatus Sulfopaludibacter sp. SbA3]|nr:hypothetical protein SBA3_1650005 [Candidatus Sulfopaludibacter sp. SbA3]